MLAQLPACRHAVLEISADETEYILSKTLQMRTVRRQHRYHVTRSIMMCHAVLLWVVEAAGLVTREEFQISVAPGVLGDQTAQSIIGFLNSRMQCSTFMSKAKLFATIFMTDDAKPMRKAFRVLVQMLSGVEADMPAFGLHALCFLHKVSLAENAAMKPLNMLSKLFCASSVVHRGSVHAALIHGSRRYVGI